METGDFYDLGSEERENIQSEIRILRGRMIERINVLMEMGMFTRREGRAWEDGIDACGDNIEWVTELSDWLDQYEDSGEETLAEIKLLLESTVWHPAEKVVWLQCAERASYQEKLNLVGLLMMTVRKRQEKATGAQRVKYASVVELVGKIKTAISTDGLGEAEKLLETMDPAHPQYKEMEQAITDASIAEVRDRLTIMQLAA